MSLDKFVDLVPVATRKAPGPREANLLLVADAPAPTTPTDQGFAGPGPGVARHADGGPDNVERDGLSWPDAGPPEGDNVKRVVAVLGPGATLKGLATRLLSIYGRAQPPRPANAKQLTADLLARGIAVYNKKVLPLDTWADFRVGLHLPLPIEIRASGAWRLDHDAVITWAASFPEALKGRLAKPPTALDVLEPAAIEADAGKNFRPRSAPGLPSVQWPRALRNPAELVLTLFAILRRIRDNLTGADDARAFALGFLATAEDHHVAQLAATTAGNAILRRIRAALAVDPVGGVDPPLDKARKLVAGALFQDPVAGRNPFPHHEVPVTTDLLEVQPRSAAVVAGAAADPPGGLHRIVLGRDVAVGRDQSTNVNGKTHTGPVIEGRLDLDPFLELDAAGLNPANDATREGLLHLLAGYGVGGEKDDDKPRAKVRLDAVKVGDAGEVSVGIAAAAATDATGLAALLFRFKAIAFDEFDLYFRMHRLDVDADPLDPALTRFRLLEIAPDGTSKAMNETERRKFFGAKGPAGGNLRYDATWAARFRLPALVSRRYRRAQVLHALTKLKPGPVKLAVASINPFPSRYDLELTDGPGSTSAVLQAEVNRVLGPYMTALTTAVPPYRSGATLAGAIVDLTGVPLVGGKPAYAGFHDDETFYVGSMDKAAAMYTALELRVRLRKALAAAEAAGLDVTKRGWQQRFLAIVETTWAGRMARGFAGFDTNMKARFPKLGQIFTLSTISPLPAAPPRARVELAASFAGLVRDMVLTSSPGAARQVIDMVGYPYLNGALREGGFYDPATKNGIWLSANYTGQDWKPKVDPVALSPRGALHYKPSTNVVGNAKQWARLLALAAMEKLFGGDADSCREMIQIMSKEGVAGAAPAYVRLAVKATPEGTAARPLGQPEIDPLKFTSKIGIGDAAPGSNLSGISDCAVIERRKSPPAAPTVLKYVAVLVGAYSNFTLPPGTGDPESAAWYGFVQCFDGAIDAQH